MNVTALNEYRLEIKLSAEELKGYDITYEDFDYANKETRRVLWTLLNEAKELSGVKLNMSGRLLIEVSSLKENGVLVCFTALSPYSDNAPSVKQLIKTGASLVILETDSINSCIDAAVASSFSGQSALYENKGIYRLVFFDCGEVKSGLCARLCRFGTLITRKAQVVLASSEELWNKIDENSAVEKLCLIS